MKNTRIHLLVMVFIIVILYGTQSALSQQSVDVILAYRGSWKVEVEHLATPQSKATHETSNLRNICWKSNEYAACNQVVNGESKILLVYVYNAAEKNFTAYTIPLNGGANGTGKIVIDGDTWIFPWQTEENGKVTYFRVVNRFTSPTHIEFRQEYSTDKEHWTQTMKGTEERVSLD